jgi:general stress protein CsbA
VDAFRITPLRIWLGLLVIALVLVLYRGSTVLEYSIAVWLVTLSGLVLLARHLHARFSGR